VDTAFSEDQMKVGRKLAVKLLNVTKFVLGFGDVDDSAVPTEPVDIAMLARLGDVVDECTKAFEDFDYARSLERTESFFWWFCDDYVELVKGRAYGSHGDAEAASARVALRRALSVIQRLFAPILPFAAEEVWSWWNDGSVHRAQWPTVSEDVARGIADSPNVDLLEALCASLGHIRRAKTEAKVSQRAEVALAQVTAPRSVIDALQANFTDVTDAGSVREATFVPTDGTDVSVDVTLA
jgi:valyl-tRNA synthetase